jgi:hypothetical protein
MCFIFSLGRCASTTYTNPLPTQNPNPVDRPPLVLRKSFHRFTAARDPSERWPGLDRNAGPASPEYATACNGAAAPSVALTSPHSANLNCPSPLRTRTPTTRPSTKRYLQRQSRCRLCGADRTLILRRFPYRLHRLCVYRNRPVTSMSAMRSKRQTTAVVSTPTYAIDIAAMTGFAEIFPTGQYDRRCRAP